MDQQNETLPAADKKKTSIFLKLVVAMIPMVILVGMLEGCAYLWERSQAKGEYAWELVASRRLDMYPVNAATGAYTLMNPNEHYAWRGIPVDINSKGLRNRETDYEKPAGTFRILNLGDSVAMGWGVRQEDTYGQQLEDLLNEQASGDVRYEVINAGVPGWTPENELAYLRDEGLKYQPDLILLDLTLVNDIYGENAIDRLGKPSVIEWLRAHTYFWPYFTIQLRWLEARSKGEDRIPVIDPPKDAASYFPLDPENPRWEKIWTWVEAIHEVALQQDIPFGVILFPLEFQVLDPNFSRLPQELITERAEAAGIPVVDLYNSFVEACQQEPGGPCSLEDRYLFADVWMHPSALGNKLTAVELDTILPTILEGNTGSLGETLPSSDHQDP